MAASGNKRNMGKVQNQKFNGDQLSRDIGRLPEGAPQMEALSEAIQKADAAQQHFWRLMFRYEYACQATFHDDPPKAMPVAGEFCQIYEEHPDALPQDSGPEAHLMAAQIAIDPIVTLPEIPFAQWEEGMEYFHSLVKKYKEGLRVYWWQVCQFYQYVDLEKAWEAFQKFWKTGRDGLSDCRACERSKAVRISLMMGDRAAADEFAKPMEQGRIRFCSQTPQLYWLAYLEDALDRGDLKEAEIRANAVYRKAHTERSHLPYIGAVLRCRAFTGLDQGEEMLSRYFLWAEGMWDQKSAYDFYKGAWCFCRQLSRKKDNIPLDLPRNSFPLWEEKGIYRVGELADWFYGRAAEIGKSFDLRNGSDFFDKDLKKAGRWLD